MIARVFHSERHYNFIAFSNFVVTFKNSPSTTAMKQGIVDRTTGCEAQQTSKGEYKAALSCFTCDANVSPGYTLFSSSS